MRGNIGQVPNARVWLGNFEAINPENDTDYLVCRQLFSIGKFGFAYAAHYALCRIGITEPILFKEQLELLGGYYLGMALCLCGVAAIAISFFKDIDKAYKCNIGSIDSTRITKYAKALGTGGVTALDNQLGLAVGLILLKSLGSRSALGAISMANFPIVLMGVSFATICRELLVKQCLGDRLTTLHIGLHLMGIKLYRFSNLDSVKLSCCMFAASSLALGATIAAGEGALTLVLAGIGTRIAPEIYQLSKELYNDLIQYIEQKQFGDERNRYISVIGNTAESYNAAFAYQNARSMCNKLRPNLNFEFINQIAPFLDDYSHLTLDNRRAIDNFNKRIIINMDDETLANVKLATKFLKTVLNAPVPSVPSAAVLM